MPPLVTKIRQVSFKTELLCTAFPSYNCLNSAIWLNKVSPPVINKLPMIKRCLKFGTVLFNINNNALTTNKNGTMTAQFPNKNRDKACSNLPTMPYSKNMMIANPIKIKPTISYINFGESFFVFDVEVFFDLAVPFLAVVMPPPTFFHPLCIERKKDFLP